VEKKPKGDHKGAKEQIMFQILMKFHYFADITERGDRSERESDFANNFIRYHIVKRKGN
jgi:hypothetical protein